MRLLICAALFMGFTGLVIAADKIDPAKLVGKWEDKNPGKGETLTVEFSKDGNVKLVRTVKGKEKFEEGTYKVEGDKLTLKVHPGNKKKTTEKVVTIDKLTDEEFVQIDDQKATKTFARMKAAEIAKTEAPKTEAPKFEPLPKGTLPEADFKLTAADFAQEFKKDANAAEKKYKDKIIELNGTVTRYLGPNLGLKTSTVTIETPNAKDSEVVCESDDPEFFARVGRGQTVRIRGKLGQFGMALRSSEFVEVGPDTRAGVSAEAMAKDFTADQKKGDEKYDKKYLVITGTIDSIKPDGIVVLKGDGKTGVQCRFANDDQLKKYKAGDPVKLFCQMNRYDSDGYVFLYECYALAIKK